jgi:hypothetical protein
MTFDEIKEALTSTEKKVMELRKAADEASEGSKLEFKNLIDKRVDAFVEALALPSEQYREIVQSMREARA